MTTGNDQFRSPLDPRDAAAIDALVAARMDAAAVPVELQARAQHITRLLRSLELGEDVGRESEALIRATLERIVCARAAAAAQAPSGASTGAGWVAEGRELLPLDADALEALVGANYEPSRVPSGVRARATRQRALLDLLAVSDGRLGDAADRERLVGGTLAAVQARVDSQAGRMTLDAAPRRAGWRIGDLIAVAAMVLIGSAIAMPALSSSRETARQNACATNLQAAGVGFGLYAGDHREAMPMASASVVGQPWWLVGQDPARSNSANLFTLARTSYTRADELGCAAAACELRGQPPQGMMDWSSLKQVSYSYQNMFAAQRRPWTCNARFEVLADRSPVILRARAGQWIDPMENSPNHRGRGQIVLYNDGSAVWMLTPVNENGDNIWLPRQIETVLKRLANPRHAAPLNGTEAPEGVEDTFLAP
ncbi:MAG: hypothetical protein ACKVS8_13525 [Phycisphaerales bacterium]